MGLVVCLICLRLRMAVVGGVGVRFSLLGWQLVIVATG